MSRFQFTASVSCFGDTVSLMLLSHCDCMVRKLATASCHLYEGNALRDQKGNFPHRHLLCVVMKGRCVSLCTHLRIGFLLEKEKERMHFTKMHVIPPSLSQLHTVTLAHTSMLSAQCVTEWGEREAHEVNWDGLSSVVTEWRYRGDDDGLDKGGDFFQNERRADTSSAVSYIFKHSPANTGSAKYSNYRYRELKRQVT